MIQRVCDGCGDVIADGEQHVTTSDRAPVPAQHWHLPCWSRAFPLAHELAGVDARRDGD